MLQQRSGCSHQQSARTYSSGISAACGRAAHFLLQLQSTDGAWRDFDLVPGQSDAWVTAYVGSRLMPLAQEPTAPDVALAVQAALRFLQNVRHPRGGWGYNRRCEPDADSTAQVLLLFRQADHEISSPDYAALARFQLSDGAFATYTTSTPDHGWGRGHTDVTAVALRALSDLLPADHTVIRRAYASLSQDLSRPDPWASYWWPSRLYLAREVLVLQQAQPRAFPHLPPIPEIGRNANPFEQALALQVALLQGAACSLVSEMVRRLVSLQQNDGGWKSAPILRVTDPRSKSLDDELCRNSPVARDHRRLFTTATALAALLLTNVRPELRTSPTPRNQPVC
jgi:sporulenol synthase